MRRHYDDGGGVQGALLGGARTPVLPPSSVPAPTPMVMGNNNGPAEPTTPPSSPPTLPQPPTYALATGDGGMPASPSLGVPSPTPITMGHNNPPAQSPQSMLFGYGSQPNFGYSPQFANLLSAVGNGGYAPINQAVQGLQFPGAQAGVGGAPSAPLSGGVAVNPFAGGNSGFLPTGYATPPSPGITAPPSSPPPPPPPPPLSQMDFGNGWDNWSPPLQSGADSSGGSARGGAVGHFDTGGAMILTPGVNTPTSPATANPNYQNAAQQYEQMSPQQLQQLSMIYGGSPRGQAINRVLQQKRFMPTAAMAPMTNPAAMKSAAGGAVDAATVGEHFDTGGAVGYLHGDTPGRTDLLHIAPPGGSYVIPADVVSGLGEGNSIAGAAVLNRALGMGPYGTTPQVKHAGAGVPIPKPPPMFGELQPKLLNQVKAARGGAEKGTGQPTPIIAASGEFIVHPDVVRRIGGGNMKRGFEILDAFVLKKRNHTIETMKKLQPPKK